MLQKIKSDMDYSCREMDCDKIVLQIRLYIVSHLSGVKKHMQISLFLIQVNKLVCIRFRNLLHVQMIIIHRNIDIIRRY